METSQAKSKPVENSRNTLKRVETSQMNGNFLSSCVVWYLLSSCRLLPPSSLLPPCSLPREPGAGDTLQGDIIRPVRGIMQISLTTNTIITQICLIWRNIRRKAVQSWNLIYTREPFCKKKSFSLDIGRCFGLGRVQFLVSLFCQGYNKCNHTNINSPK